MNREKGTRLDRRRFLWAGGILLGGATAAIYFGRNTLRRKASELFVAMDRWSGISDFEPDFWFEVLEDNTIRLKSPKVEMGQGIFTGFAMLAAEELDVPIERIDVVPGSTATSAIDVLGTGASISTASLYGPIREVAATLREMLKEAAAKHWGVDTSDVVSQDGFVISGARRLSYAEIVNHTSTWEIPDAPVLKPKSELRYIGKERARVDLKPKVMAEAIFAIDAELPEMLYANVLYSPYIGGSLASVDTSDAEAFPGVVRVIQEDELVAVVAENRYAAEMGKRKLKAEWTVPKRWQQDELDALVTVGRTFSVDVQKEGDPRARFDEAGGRVLEAEYRTPLGVHAHLEPNGVVAKVENDHALVITGTQDPATIRTQVAAALDLEEDNVEIRNAFLGGAFGRRYFRNNAVQGVRIAQIMGKPVHLFNDREEEFLNGYVRPSTHHVLKAKLSEDGIVDAIQHDVASADMGVYALESKAPGLKTILGADILLAAHGAPILYGIPHRRASIWDVEMPLQTGIWRTVGLFANGFAKECFIDELARETEQDPFAFRLQYFEDETDPRHGRIRSALQTLRNESQWDAPTAAGVGRGVALTEDRQTIAAAVVEVEMEDEKVRVRRVIEVLDPGMIINPEGVRMQCEGCVMMGISAALYEATYARDGQLSATNFHEYPMASLTDTPEIEIVLLEGADEPYFVGEPPLGPIAPAIANALFDLTGHRLRQLPLQDALARVSG